VHGYWGELVPDLPSVMLHETPSQLISHTELNSLQLNGNNATYTKNACSHTLSTHITVPLGKAAIKGIDKYFRMHMINTLYPLSHNWTRT